jgi:hypothetical protein
MHLVSGFWSYSSRFDNSTPTACRVCWQYTRNTHTPHPHVFVCVAHCNMTANHGHGDVSYSRQVMLRALQQPGPFLCEHSPNRAQEIRLLPHPHDTVAWQQQALLTWQDSQAGPWDRSLWATACWPDTHVNQWQAPTESQHPHPECVAWLQRNGPASPTQGTTDPTHFWPGHDDSAGPITAALQRAAMCNPVPSNILAPPINSA